MLHIFYGQDDFSSNAAINELRERLGLGGVSDSNVSSLDGRHVSLGQLKAVCDAYPFLSERRLALVEGLFSRFMERPARRGRREPSRFKELAEWTGLADYARAMPPTTELLLADGDVPKNHPLLRQLSAIGETREFRPPDKENLHEWIKARVSAHGGSMTPSAVALLASLVGGNLWAMQGEVEKLCLYAGNRPISDVDVRTLVSNAREANIFAMVDAVIEGRASLALQMMEQLLDGGAAAPYIITMIARQLRLMVQAKEMLGHQLQGAEIGARLEIRQEFALKRLLRQARDYSPDRVKALYHGLLDADLAIKTGRLKDELALELYVTEALAGGR